MKKINIKIAITILFIGVSVLNSCSNDFLEETPTDSILISNSILTEEDLVIAVNGVYNLCQSTSSYGAMISTLNELSADNAFVSVQNSNRFVNTNDGSYITAIDGNIASVWNSLYSIIANCNNVLASENKIESNANTKHLYAQVRAIRAYSFFMLVAYFSPNYGEGDQSYGIPLPLTYDVTARLPRKSVSEVYDQIISDLNSSIPNFSTQTALPNTRMNAVAANLLLARVYLFKKDYANAIAKANLVLNDTSSILLPSSGVSAFFGLGGESNRETLFQVEYNSADLPGSNDSFLATWSTSGVYKQNFATRDFWNTISSTDVRKNTWFANNAAVNNYPDNPKPIDVRKYLSTSRDIIQFRKTEAIFIKAESEYYSNPTTAAATLENWVKAYRDALYTIPATTGVAVLDEILHQKSIEFFVEGHRWFDLKRNKRQVNKPQTALLIPSSDKRFVWPIPQRETLNNPNITQYPGY